MLFVVWCSDVCGGILANMRASLIFRCLRAGDEAKAGCFAGEWEMIFLICIFIFGDYITINHVGGDF